MSDHGLGWDGESDPKNPRSDLPMYHSGFTWLMDNRNFPAALKWRIFSLISCMIVIGAIASSIVAPGASLTAREFGTHSPILKSLNTGVFVLGYIVGPLVMSPISEIYGRRPIIDSANCFFTLWQIGCALAPSMEALLFFRFFSGLGASVCMTVSGGIVTDLFDVQQRGTANAILAAGPMLGPVIGAVLGGFIAERAGWRWIFWVLFAACATCTAAIMLFTRETYGPVILRREPPVRPDSQLSIECPKAANDLEHNGIERKRDLLTRGIMRPLRMLIRSPILLILSVYVSFVFSLLFLLFTTIASLFTQVYGWSIEQSGLSYLGLGLGNAAGLVIFAKTSDATVARLTRANNGVYEPEMRLAPALISAFFIPVSLFWYGWSAEAHTHWIVPIISLVPFGIGVVGAFASAQSYIIDSAGRYAASAVAALTVLRCVFAAFLPLAGPVMYRSLGPGWGNSVLGFVALGMLPAPALIYKFGALLRQKYAIDKA